MSQSTNISNLPGLSDKISEDAQAKNMRRNSGQERITGNVVTGRLNNEQDMVDIGDTYQANAFISIRYGLPKSRKTRNCIMYYEFSAGFWKNQDILIPLNRDLNTGRDCQSPPPPNVTQAFF
ncbi:19011_t:CDS:2 [Rhizophagus irregularis]|nr:19011_t:CDS:2 [Rhizophagus irregularis]